MCDNIHIFYSLEESVFHKYREKKYNIGDWSLIFKSECFLAMLKRLKGKLASLDSANISSHFVRIQTPQVFNVPCIIKHVDSGTCIL